MLDSWYISGERIRKCRGKMSQDMICDRIEELTGERPKRGTLSSWETGKTCPSLKQLSALAYVCNVSVSYLLGDCETDKTGLSADAIIALREMNAAADPAVLLISKLIEDHYRAIYTDHDEHSSVLKLAADLTDGEYNESLMMALYAEMRNAILEKREEQQQARLLEDWKSGVFFQMWGKSGANQQKP